MYAANTNGPSNDHADHKKAAHAKSMKKRPKYMGLRVTRYTPALTKDDAASGFIGLTVVFARRKATTPEALKAAPTTAKPTPRAMRASGIASSEVVTRERHHIAAATSSATSGGGILSSSARMTTMGPRQDGFVNSGAPTPATT